MIVNTALKTVAPFVPVAGSAYGFARTCVKVYKSTSPTKALVAGVKGIVIDCTPPVIKYPLHHQLLNIRSYVREPLLVVELLVSQAILILLWERLNVAVP